GINFATVTILLIKAAVSTPFKIRKCTPQSSNEATIILGNVLPFSWASTMSQVKSTMLVTVWVFIGIEGAVIFSSRAKNKKDV
nr:hypothetical protein [Staphylococcus aureus]